MLEKQILNMSLDELFLSLGFEHSIKGYNYQELLVFAYSQYRAMESIFNPDYHDEKYRPYYERQLRYFNMVYSSIVLLLDQKRRH